MQGRLTRENLLESGMGCFLFAAAVTLVNALLLPFARACHGYPAAPTFVSFALALCAFLLFGRLLHRADGARLERIARALLPAFLIALFALHLLLGYWMAYTPSGDNHMLIDGAKMLAADGSFAAEPDYSLYLSRYSNQWGFMLMLTALFKLFAALGVADFLFALVVLQAALYTLGMLAAADIARGLAGVRGVLALLLVLSCCMPLYLAAAVLYTDTFSLPFILLTLCFALRVLDARTARARIGFALAAALLATLGAQVKMTAFIALMAAAIVWVLRLRAREGICCLALTALVAAGGMALAQGYMTDKVLDPAMVAQHHTPAIHWVMMSIPTGDNPYGASTGDYGETWGMMEQGATRQEVMDSIYRRMKDRIYTLRYPNRLITAALRKNANAMGDGSFGMTEMLDDGPVRENAVSAVVLEGRPYYLPYRAVCSGIHLATLALAAAGCLRDIRRRDTRAAMLYVAMFGMMLFLMLWEARPRYLFGFVPVLLLLCARFIARDEKGARA